MCGFAGIFDLRAEKHIDQALVEAMTHSLKHRGPDEHDFAFSPHFGFGHRRLCIIDKSGGKQPIKTADGKVTLIFNGEIYNYQALAKQLIAKGYPLKTRSDSEVILYAWQAWGTRCVEHFNGMFAFALWDATRNCAFLACDRLGIKPLYYAKDNNGQWLFGSELKALLKAPSIERVLDPQSIENYFTLGYIPAPGTIYQNVFKMEPGTRLLLQADSKEARPERYWDIDFTQSNDMSLEQAEEEFLSRFEEAVRLRLMADVPLGAFLSGGVDSSAVVSMMAGLSAQAVQTCAIGFKEKEYDESMYANQVADHLKTDHHQANISAHDLSLVDELIHFYDEPFADSSALPTYRVSELARQKVTVALSGDGGDENFVGYRRHRWHAEEERLRGWMPGWLRRGVFAPAAKCYPKLDFAPRWLRAKSTLRALSLDSTAAYLDSVSLTTALTRKNIFSDDFSKSLAGFSTRDLFDEVASRQSFPDAIRRIQYLDFKLYLPGDILTKVDRASMAHSLEVRVPFLDHHLVEWLATVPTKMKLKGREGKYLLKNALHERLPKSILYRDKRGFAVPIAQWFRGELKEKTQAALSDPVLSQSGLFEPKALQKVFADHQSGLANHDSLLWSLYMFHQFLSKVHPR